MNKSQYNQVISSQPLIHIFIKKYSKQNIYSYIMSQNYHQDKEFESKDYSNQTLEKMEFENCTFRNCDFSSSNLSSNEFCECRFINCNFSMAKLRNSMMKEVEFDGCKLIGVDFSICSEFLFSISCSNSHIDLSSFHGMKLKNMAFNDCSIKEVDFTNCDLQGATFSNCDLENTIFSNTKLQKSDFSTAHNYIIDPEQNRIKKAQFSQSGISGLLHKYDIEIY